ncbi:MAG: hypothetical protein M0R17_05065 [Candidatus Omnitrophica bacterium]|nr:hypothetical protein [Candidatus Omnitrophota bacterium]
MKFLILSLNNTATIVFYLSFISFVLFILNDKSFWKESLIVFIISLIICLFTPNSIEEQALFFKIFK